MKKVDLQYAGVGAANIAKNLDEKERTDIALEVIEDFRRDNESRSAWLDMHASWMRLYYQRDKPVNRPWSGSSDESVPILTEACTQFQARAYKAFFPGRKIVSAIPVVGQGRELLQRADRIGKHFSWQLTVQDRTYKKNKDSLLLSVPLHGSFFTKTWHDPTFRKNMVENVRAEDLVVPYGVGPRSIEDLERKTQIVILPEGRARDLFTAEWFSEMPEIYSTPDDRPTTTAQDAAQGLTAPSEVKECRIYECHKLLDLDEDGFMEPYIIWVDAQSQKMLRMSVRWEVDEVGQPVQNAWYDIKQPIEYFTHYQFLPNPDGFYGMGLGHLVGGANSAVNKMLRQLIDAGTLQNSGNMSGFISEALSVEKGGLTLNLGEFKKVPASVDDLRKGIFQMQFAGPSTALFEAMQGLKADANRLGSTTEALTGQIEKVMQPTTILTLVEQGLQLFSSVQMRILNAWEDELLKLYKLNSKYLPKEATFAFVDAEGLEEIIISAADYSPDMRIVPIIDPSMLTEQQKLQKAQAEWQFTTANPLTAQNPIALYNAAKRYLKAIGADAIEEILPKVSGPQRSDDQYEENAGYLMPQPIDYDVFEEQNHQEHIAIIDQFVASGFGQMMPPPNMGLLGAHKQKHIAYLYAQSMKQQQEQENAQLAAQQAINEELAGLGLGGGMGAPPGVEGVPQGLGGEVPAPPILDIGGIVGTPQ